VNLALTILYTAMMFSLLVSILFSKQFGDRNIRPLVILGAMVMAYGMFGWCAALLSVGGAFDRLPPTFEYPIWRTSGAVTLVDGTHVVPHTPSGRIQVYDRDWHYVRGWRVPSGGGDFRLLESTKDRIEVFIERGDGRATYDLAGTLLGLEWETARPSEKRLPGRVTVPTPFMLRPFSSMFFSWSIAIAGGIILSICHASILRSEKAREGRAILEEVEDLDDAAPEPRRDR